MANEVTFTPEALQQVIAQAVAEALRARDAKPMPKNTLVDGKTEQQLRIDIMVLKAFKKAGYGEVKPREDVMTYNKWLASGHKLRTGERATKVKQFRLFHKSQVDYVSIPPKEAAPSEAEVTAVKEAKASSSPSIMQRLKGKASAQTSLPV
jgi:hypothetical protein